MGHKTPRDFSALSASVVLSEQVERKGQQDMLRERMRSKVILGCAGRCMPAEQHWAGNMPG